MDSPKDTRQGDDSDGSDDRIQRRRTLRMRPQQHNLTEAFVKEGLPSTGMTGRMFPPVVTGMTGNWSGFSNGRNWSNRRLGFGDTGSTGTESGMTGNTGNRC